ncbi:MAG: FAD-binding oxidoreductase [Myxococcales bacterium]|nr:FAD-binding oxidoreductase [Myxococcales bacterium]
MTVSYWMDQSATEPPVEVDVCIIGAGIAGASTAYWLKDAGLKVAVIDKGDVACGASGRNAGFVTCGSVEHFAREAKTRGEQVALDLWQMSQENLRLIETELVGKGLDCDFKRGGTYSLAGTAHELEVLGETATHLQARGVPVTVLSAEQVNRDIQATGFAGGVLYHDDGEVHPGKLVRGILERSGADFYPHHEVRRIEDHPAGPRIHTRLRTFHAGVVVFATNGWSGELNPWLGERIAPTRGQILVTDPVAPFLPAPCYANFVLDYFRQLPDGRLLIGGFRQLAKETEVGTADVLHPEIQANLEAFLKRHFPALAHARVAYRWAGTMGFSQDGMPIIGALPGRSDLYCVAGFTGHGIGWGFKAGQLLADLLLHGKTPPHVSTRRF